MARGVSDFFSLVSYFNIAFTAPVVLLTFKAFGNIFSSESNVGRLNIESNGIPASGYRGDGCASGTCERVEHSVASERKERDQALGKHDGIRRRMSVAEGRAT